MQQCRFVYTITRADCRACNGLDAGCRNYEPNPDEKAWRETDAEAKRQLPRKLFPPCEVNSLKLQDERWRPLEGGNREYCLLSANNRSAEILRAGRRCWKKSRCPALL